MEAPAPPRRALSSAPLAGERTRQLQPGEEQVAGYRLPSHK